MNIGSMINNERMQDMERVAVGSAVMDRQRDVLGVLLGFDEGDAMVLRYTVNWDYQSLTPTDRIELWDANRTVAAPRVWVDALGRGDVNTEQAKIEPMIATFIAESRRHSERYRKNASQEMAKLSATAVQQELKLGRIHDAVQATVDEFHDIARRTRSAPEWPSAFDAVMAETEVESVRNFSVTVQVVAEVMIDVEAADQAAAEALAVDEYAEAVQTAATESIHDESAILRVVESQPMN